MSKETRNKVNAKRRKPSKNTGFGKLMISIIVLGIAILLFINYALPLLKKEATHVAAKKTVDIITDNPEKIAGDNQQIKKVIESMTDEDKEKVTEIIENHMDAETTTEIIQYVKEGDREALMEYAQENLTAEEITDLIEMYGKYSNIPTE